MDAGDDGSVPELDLSGISLDLGAEPGTASSTAGAADDDVAHPCYRPDLGQLWATSTTPAQISAMPAMRATPSASPNSQ